MTKPNEPTLTCSEVVERLRNEAMDWDRGGNDLDPVKAEKVLHSWRERRVQELEEWQRVAKRMLSAMIDGDLLDQPTTDEVRDLLGAEWREQIRKGAKHD